MDHYRIIDGRMRLVRRPLPGPSHSRMIDLRLEKHLNVALHRMVLGHNVGKRVELVTLTGYAHRSCQLDSENSRRAQ